MQRHRHQEFIRFLNQIERDVPMDKAVHVTTACVYRVKRCQNPKICRIVSSSDT